MRKLLAWAKALSEVLAPVAANALLLGVKGRAAAEARGLAARISPLFRRSLRTDLLPPSRVSTMPKAGSWRGKRVVVYHHSKFPHLDLLLDTGQKAHSIGVKRLSAPLKLNAEGALTQASKDEAMALLRREFDGRAWLGASTDHTPEGARGGPPTRGYGAGPVREVISDKAVHVTSNGQKVSWFDWDMNKECYAFKIMSQGPRRGVNILSLGVKRVSPPNFSPRLSLKFDHTPEAFLRRLGPNPHITEKIDGSALHFSLTAKGFRAWSPRISQETGQRIGYTQKLGQLASVELRTTSPVMGMGELVFIKPGAQFRGLYELLWPGLADKFGIGSRAAFNEVAGILNARRLPPPGWQPRLYVYRVDSLGRKNLLKEDWSANRERCAKIARLSPYLNVPREITPSPRALAKLVAGGAEGAVGVSRGSNIVDSGRKWKPRGELIDARIDQIGFRPGPQEGVAGTIRYTDLANGRVNNISSGFSEGLKREMMSSPSKFVGRVMRLTGFSGHQSRAAKFSEFVDFHQDK